MYMNLCVHLSNSQAVHLRIKAYTVALDEQVLWRLVEHDRHSMLKRNELDMTQRWNNKSVMNLFHKPSAPCHQYLGQETVLILLTPGNGPVSPGFELEIKEAHNPCSLVPGSFRSTSCL